MKINYVQTTTNGATLTFFNVDGVINGHPYIDMSDNGIRVPKWFYKIAKFLFQ